jgi:uncharacterized membrane protein YfcA
MDLLSLGFSLILAMLIGLSLGLLGSGGSIITLPVLVYVAGIPAHQAVGMSLVIVGGTSVVGRCSICGRVLSICGRRRSLR